MTSGRKISLVLFFSVFVLIEGGLDGAGSQQSVASAAPPPNDACTNATVIGNTIYTDSEQTSAATSQSSDPIPQCCGGGAESCPEQSTGKSIWYRFTAPANGTLTADTFDSDYDTILTTFSGTCGALSAVPGGCNDDDPFDGAQSKVSFGAVDGATYYLMVSAYNNDGGNSVLHFRFVPNTLTPTPTATQFPTTTPTPQIPCRGDCDGSAALTAADLVRVVAILVNCPCATGPGGAAAGCSAVAAASRGCIPADLNSDGCVSLDELDQLTSNVFECFLEARHAFGSS